MSGFRRPAVRISSFSCQDFVALDQQPFRQFSLFGAKLEGQMSGFRRFMSGFRRPVSGFRRPLSGFRRFCQDFVVPMSGFRRPCQDFVVQLSGFRRFLSGFRRFSV